MKKIVAAIWLVVSLCILTHPAFAQKPQPAAAQTATPVSNNVVQNVHEVQSGNASVTPLPEGAGNETKQAHAEASEKSGGSETDQARQKKIDQRAAAISHLWAAITAFHRNHSVWAIVLDIIALFFAIGILGSVVSSWGVYTWYPFIIVVVWFWTWISGETDYFWVFVLGMATAFAEIIGKFSDEPLKAVKTGHAVFYHVFNGAVAVFALYVLNLFTTHPTDAGGHLKNILAAGLGAMLVMRSKLFNIKVAGEDVSFGPEQIVKIFLSFMEEAIDRIRARNRIDFLKPHVEAVDLRRFANLTDYVTAMMRSSQTRTMEEKNAFEKNIADIINAANPPKDARNKCYALGFELLNVMGENFAVEVFENMPPDLRRIAPATPAASGLLDKLLFRTSPPPEVTQYYVAYGSDMSGARFRERLKWSEEEFSKISPPKKSVLSKYRIAFNKPDEISPETGCANIVPDEKENVEGVLYTLSKEQLQFLDKAAPGYARKTVSVSVDNKSLDAEVYLATITKDSLQPNAIAVNDVIKGAEENKLSEEYITKLRSFITSAVASTEFSQTGKSN